MTDNPTSHSFHDDETQLSQSPHHRLGSTTSKASKQSLQSVRSDESTPLLSRVDDEPYRDDPDNDGALSDTFSATSLEDGDSGKRAKRKWPIIAALCTLILVVVVILGLGFAAPSAVEEYAQQAAVFEPTDLSIESFTADGVKARIKGDFALDSSRVSKKWVRDLGRAGTWIAGAVETKPTTILAYLPEYGNVLIGTADVPAIVVSIRDGHANHIDLIAHLRPGEIDGLRRIAMDWVEGRLGQLRIQGQANVALKSGIFSLGTQNIVETLTFKGHDIPTLPHYHISKINIHETNLPENEKGMSADVSITVSNDYPVTLTVPPLAFDVLVAGCTEGETFIKLANATSKTIEVSPKHDIVVVGEGTIRQLSDSLLTHCPESTASPLDALVDGYINGGKTKVYVKGADYPGRNPDWISELTKSVTIPVPLSGRSMDELIRDLAMDDVRLGMPNPLADPDSREAQPSVSAIVNVIVNLPDEMNFPVNVSRVRSNPDVFYKGKKFGVLDLDKWHFADTTPIDRSGDEPAALLIKTRLENAPIWITDHNVFSTIVQKMLFGGNVTLDLKAGVDIEVETAIGTFVLREIPAEGQFPLKPLSDGSDLRRHLPKIGDLNVIETSRNSIILGISANLSNPTNYSASIPYVNVNVLSNNSVHLAQVVIRDLKIVPGANDDLIVQVEWSPDGFSGRKGVSEARELISRHLSNYNTSLILQTHNGTFPSNPLIGSVLSNLRIEIPTPPLSNPCQPANGHKCNEGYRFVQDATMHLLSSTATFRLKSPLKHTTILITDLDVTAYWNHTERVGQIIYDSPIPVPPGITETPNLPVEWSLGSVGYGAVKDALGGSLKLDSKALVRLQVGQFATEVWHKGSGIGAHVRL